MSGYEVYALYALVAAAAVTTVAASTQARGAKKMSDHNKHVFELNAVQARKQAAAQAELQGRDARRRIGSARAAYGASGVAFEGSPIDVLEESASLAELDRQTILYAGELRARGLDDSGAMAGYEGRAASRAGYARAGASLIKGAASAYSAWNQSATTDTGGGYDEMTNRP